jgi:hypothetical protein
MSESQEYINKHIFPFPVAVLVTVLFLFFSSLLSYGSHSPPGGSLLQLHIISSTKMQ